MTFILQAYGMAILPIDLIRGSRNVRREKLDVQSRRANNRDRIEAIKNKVHKHLHYSIIIRFDVDRSTIRIVYVNISDIGFNNKNALFGYSYEIFL